MASDPNYDPEYVKAELEYPVVFYGISKEKGHEGEYFKEYEELGNLNSMFGWDVKHKGGFIPSKKSWRRYQSSTYIPVGSNSPVRLNSIGNVFYEIEDSVAQQDNMRVLIRAPKLVDLDFGEIQSITDSYKSKLSSVAILPYGYSNAFCMDTGVSRNISISYERVMPVNPNDKSSDSRNWSNSRWMQELKKYTNRWQMRTNGVELHVLMPQAGSPTGLMDECYPDINPNPDPDNVDLYKNWVNAYITSAPVTYDSKSTHKISGSIEFQIGTIYPKATPLKSIILEMKLLGHSNIETMSCIDGARIPAPVCPSNLLKQVEDAVFTGWSYLESSAAPTFDAGTPITIEEYEPGCGKMYLYAHYKIVKSYYGDRSIIFNDEILSPNTLYRVRVQGAGGGGGAVGKDWSGFPWFKNGGGGGGGGSGYLTTSPISFMTYGDNFPQLIAIRVGLGGAGFSHSYVNGLMGGQTVANLIYYDEDGHICVGTGPDHVVAKGGEYGRSGLEDCKPGSGGSGGNSGGGGGRGGCHYMDGLTPIDIKSEKGTDGSGDKPGGAEECELNTTDRGGGGGGGSPQLKNLNGELYGRGGAGHTNKNQDSSDKYDGVCGGGGGGGSARHVSRSWAGQGGDGAYLIYTQR